MKIKVNGKIEKMKDSMTVIELLKSKGYNTWVGVWVNGNQLLQKEYESYIIKDNDDLKIIKPLGGG